MYKTPTSILQEVLVQRKQALPDYCYEDAGPGCYGLRFKCTVRIGDLRASGEAGTKKDSKHKSAENALIKMGITMDTSEQRNPIIVNKGPSSRTAPTINFVGKLNELASISGNRYPEYCERVVTTNGAFVATCSFLEWQAEGTGCNKKAAKQDSARNMLESIKDKDISPSINGVKNLSSQRFKNINNLERLSEVAKIVEQLTSTNRQIIEPSDQKPLVDFRSKSFDSLEDVQAALERKGHKSIIKCFQRNPYIMMMRIEGTNCVMMGDGKQKGKLKRIC